VTATALASAEAAETGLDQRKCVLVGEDDAIGAPAGPVWYEVLASDAESPQVVVWQPVLIPTVFCLLTDRRLRRSLAGWAASS
jgi:hypothetical protein